MSKFTIRALNEIYGYSKPSITKIVGYLVEVIVSQINNKGMIYLPPIYLTNKHVGILMLVIYNSFLLQLGTLI